MKFKLDDFMDQIKDMTTKITMGATQIQVGSNSSIQISNNTLTVNGKKYDLDKLPEIKIEGPVGNLKVEACKSVSVTGSVGDVNTLSGDVKCGGDAQDIQTMSGDVIVHGGISGNISSMSGDVTVKSK